VVAVSLKKKPALWTTFAPEGVELLRDDIKKGEFQ